MADYPLCPKCGTELVPREDKFDCPGCGNWYYLLNFPDWIKKQIKGE